MVWPPQGVKVNIINHIGCSVAVAQEVEHFDY